MADIQFEIQGLKSLVRNLKNSQKISRQWWSKALRASIFEIQKRTQDGGEAGGLFMFKTPRAMRTGYLARSFAFGISYGENWAKIGPTADYADYVYFGTKRMVPNPFLERIKKDAEPDILKHFGEAANQITIDIAKLDE